ncbi:MAG TPA: glycosyltransferase family 9 protein [Parafilimonas sp.]|nr:glycosyltransferase family 9 protein [Parafilimonas sp.]
MDKWNSCKNILCIRPDNMGDVIMSSPAFRALKETFDCKITLLTSSMGSLIAPFIKEIDDTIVFDLPWIKTNDSIGSNECIDIIKKLEALQFDAAIIFTVYSQNPLPTATLAYMANIPLRLAYCRENPYALLTDWVPDKEPYTFIQHQVERDLNLVKHIGATTTDDKLHLHFSNKDYASCLQKLSAQSVNVTNGFIVLHAGVSEKKREYSTELWIETAKRLYERTGSTILLSGSSAEKKLTDYIQQQAGENIFSIAGLLNIGEFIALIAHAQLVATVNTATAHIAAATQTATVVLYAQTNPQHEPWKTRSVVLPYSVPQNLQSKNEVIQFVNKQHYTSYIKQPSPQQIINAAAKITPSLMCGILSPNHHSVV